MYKLSQYNYFIEHKSRVIYFNGMTGALFSLSSKEHENMQKLFDDPISFHITYNSVFNRFKNWGFILEEDINEIDLIRFKNSTSIFTDKNYRLIINPTEDCTFNCWYCTQHQKEPKGGMKKDLIKIIKRHLDYMVKEEKITGLFLDWFGGEPLMYFDEVVYPIAKHALKLANKYNLPFTHHATTNAYLINESMSKKMAEIKLNSFQITLDGDKKRHNKVRNAKGTPSFDKIMESIDFILKNIPNSFIILRINFEDKTLKESNILSIFKLFPSKYRKRIRVNFVRVWQTVKKGEEKNLILEKLTQKVIDMGFMVDKANSFHAGRPYKCYADRLYHGVINYDGKVYKCTARTDKEMGKLHENGWIEWNNEVVSKLYATAAFENEKCLKCKHLPICLGTCSQEKKTKIEPIICALEYSEVTPEDFIIDSYLSQVNYNN